MCMEPQDREDATAVTSAPCPICGKPFPLPSINGHIDLCLLAANTGTDSQDHESEEKTKTRSVKTPPSLGTGKEGGRKRNSPAPPRPRLGSNQGKQSLLGFGRDGARDEHPPPTKSRKISTPKTSRGAFVPKRGLASESFPGVEASAGSSGAFELSAPLAEIMRPKSLEDFVGQEGAMGKNSILRTVMESGQVPSLIFWGPPGYGKTTLARIMARVAKEKHGVRFSQLSATTSGVSDVKEVVRVAKNERIMFKRKTILFIDEIHRFNKLQQDTFLPHVEDGTITLLGATTENPSFQLNSALLSRCRVIVLEKLESMEIERLLKRALPRIGARQVPEEGEDEVETQESEQASALVLVESAAILTIAQLCDGDARSALNGLQVAVQAKREKHQQSSVSTSCPISPGEQSSIIPETPDSSSSTSASTEIESAKQRTSGVHTPVVCDSDSRSQTIASDLLIPSLPSSSPTSPKVTLPPLTEPRVYPCPVVTVADAKESLQRTHLLYDMSGEEHYNSISALHKSMRGSDANASLYWLARMLCAGEDPLYIARRVVRFASEDVGLADPSALNQAVAAFQACQFIGMPECEVILAQAVVYMARARKSVEVYLAYDKAKASVKKHKGPLPAVPLHLRNAPTRLMTELGYGRGYKYNPAFSEPVEQEYMPAGMQGIDFFST